MWYFLHTYNINSRNSKKLLYQFLQDENPLAVAKLAHFFTGILLMFEMILNVSVLRAWHHTASSGHHTASSRFRYVWVEKTIKIQLNVTLFKFQLPKPNLHRLWILLIVKCVSNALLSSITYRNPAKQKNAPPPHPQLSKLRGASRTIDLSWITLMHKLSLKLAQGSLQGSRGQDYWSNVQGSETMV